MCIRDSYHALHILCADRCIQIHRGTGVQTDHRSHQHPALEDKFIPVVRERNAFQKTFHHIVVHQNLRILSVFFERLRIKSFNCLAVFIIRVPPNTGVKSSRPETVLHSAPASASPCLFGGHTLSERPEMFAPRCDSGCTAHRRSFAPYHKPTHRGRMGSTRSPARPRADSP